MNDCEYQIHAMYTKYLTLDVIESYARRPLIYPDADRVSNASDALTLACRSWLKAHTDPPPIHARSAPILTWIKVRFSPNTVHTYLKVAPDYWRSDRGFTPDDERIQSFIDRDTTHVTILHQPQD